MEKEKKSAETASGTGSVRSSLADGEKINSLQKDSRNHGEKHGSGSFEIIGPERVWKMLSAICTPHFTGMIFQTRSRWSSLSIKRKKNLKG